MRRPTERGAGLLSTTFGVAVLIAFVGTAANVGLGLWARAAVDAAAADAGRRLAAAPADRRAASDRAEVLARAVAQLGPFGRRVRMSATDLGDQVTVHVTAPAIGLLPRLVRGGALVPALDRRIVVRREDT